jgi:hypothetical protein
MSNATAPANSSGRESTVLQILGQTVEAGKKAVVTGVNSFARSSGYSGVSFTEEGGNYFMKTLFYLTLYAFLLFLVLVLVHFTIRPVFRFIPGGKGVIGVPGTSDDVVYWNTKRQPASSASAPPESDNLAAYPFINNFSFSVDLYVRRLTDTDRKNRLILFKTNRRSSELSAPPSSSTLADYMSENSSLILYLTDTNDLVVTMFSGGVPTQYASPYIKNVPLYTPFRVSVVVEDKTFTVYLNGKQTFQRVSPTPFALNSKSAALTGQQRFYAPPAWADSPTKSIFLQNFHVWPRAITYDEVLAAQPALARPEDFDLPPEPTGGSCY